MKKYTKNNISPPTAKQSKWSALKRKSDAEAAIDVVEQIIPIPSLVLRWRLSSMRMFNLAHEIINNKRGSLKADRFQIYRKQGKDSNVQSPQPELYRKLLFTTRSDPSIRRID